MFEEDQQKPRYTFIMNPQNLESIPHRTDPPLTRTIGPNTSGRDFAVGDIHGCYDKLFDALDDAGFVYGRDRLFAVGDLIDRGPQSKECLLLLTTNWFFSVLGNHEKMMLDRDYQVWVGNGGYWWLDVPPFEKLLLESLVRNNCTYSITLEHSSGKRVGFVHAQPPCDDWDNMTTINSYGKDTCLWSRRNIAAACRGDYAYSEHDYDKMIDSVDNVDLIVMGHTPKDDIVTMNNQMWIDTGAYSEFGKFTVVCLDELLSG